VDLGKNSPRFSQRGKLSTICEENLKLTVSNTFIHVKDVNEEALKLSRSWSDPSLTSSSDTLSSFDSPRFPETSPWADPLENRRDVFPGSGSDHAFVPSSSRSTTERSGSEGEESHDDIQALERADAASTLLSAGSANHGTNTCKPCVFLHQEHGCYHGIRCVFCHHSHSRKSKPRPSKSKRDKAKEMVSRRHTDQDPSGPSDESPRASTKLQL